MVALCTDASPVPNILKPEQIEMRTRRPNTKRQLCAKFAINHFDPYMVFITIITSITMALYRSPEENWRMRRISNANIVAENTLVKMV